MKNNKLTILIASALVLSMALTGCGSKEDTKQPSLEVDANIQTNVDSNKSETNKVEQVINEPELSTPTEELGWIHITVDVETNRPTEFRDYNFYVNIVNKETAKWNLVDVYYDNGYKARAELPYGSYFIAEAGVQKDYLGEFALTTGQEFTLDKNIHAVDVQLGFTTEHIVGSTTVSDISDKIDPFEYLNIEYTGISPYARIQLLNTSNDTEIGKIRFKANIVDKLAIGDEIKVTAEYKGSTSDNIELTNTEKIFVVENMDRYITSYLITLSELQ